MDGLVFVFQVATGLFILTLLVVIHELGHAIVAKRNGVNVEEFGIGFPPQFASLRLRNGILLSINYLPLGGFVKLQGENDAANKKGDYGATSLWTKTKILLAGVMMNWVFAAVLLTILAVTGFPKVLENQFTIPSDTKEVQYPLKVTYVNKGSPADKIGLEVNDRILTVMGEPIQSPEVLSKITSAHQGQYVDVKYQRNGQTFNVRIQLRYNPDKSKGVLGVATSSQTLRYSTWSAPIVGVGTTVQFSWVTLQGLGDLIGKLTHGLAQLVSGDSVAKNEGSKEISSAGSSVGGPLSIVGVFLPAAQTAGLTSLVFLTAIISLTLAVMNILPIPALDGGRLFLAIVFRAIKRPLTKRLEDSIVGYSFAALMVLVVIITVADVFKLQSL